MFRPSIFLATIAMLGLSACSSTPRQVNLLEVPRAATLSGQRPIVIAHRGASGYLPEHTLAAYERAIEMGADFIEPDLVPTKDGVLVARHENEISGTTDVAAKFPERKTTKTVDGHTTSGWFTEDFTWAELKTLRAKERLGFRDQSNNGKYPIPSFQEILALVKKTTARSGRPLGVYPELKHPSYFTSIGLPLEERVLEELKRAGFRPEKKPVYIQCFEADSLKKLRAVSSWKLVLLLERGDLTWQPLTEKRLQEIRTFADGIGPDKRMLLPKNIFGSLSNPTDLVELAHKVGLVVHPYTFRSDKSYLAAAYGENPDFEYFDAFRLGVDGVFSDFTDHAVRAREKFFNEPKAQNR